MGALLIHYYICISIRGEESVVSAAELTGRPFWLEISIVYYNVDGRESNRTTPSSTIIEHNCLVGPIRNFCEGSALCKK